TMKGNKVFLLAGGFGELKESGRNWKWGKFELKLVVGDVTNPTGGKLSERIKWGPIRSPLNESTIAAHKVNLTEFVASGGSGVLMEEGTIVFPLMAKSGNETEDVYSMIIYSTDDGEKWSLSTGMSPAKCFNPRITEWKGSLLMIVDCENGQSVFESRDMGKTWTEAVGTLSGVWVKSRSGFRWDEGLRVDALITATIEGMKVMLYTQRGYASGEKEANALCLWVTDNNRTFHIGPLFGEDNVNETFSSNLLYSDGALHLLKERANEKGSAISLARLTDELKTINSVLSTWAQLDAFFSKSSTPTAGLVGFLSNTSSGGDTWIDEYRCVNASVTKAAKVKNGFKFKGPGSMAKWPVNSREDNRQYGFVNHRFTLVATVAIHQVAKGSTSLLGAGLDAPVSTNFIGLSYSVNKTWETVFDGKKTTSNTTWELGKEHQVALMLQDGNKGSVYVNGKIVGSPETITTLGALGHEITQFYFGGGEGDINSNLTVKNVFLYNRPLSVGELKMVRKSDDKKGNGGGKKGNGDGSMRGGVSRLLLLLGLGFCAFVALY
ncbi:surface protein-2, partial [Trypanosoma cruzi]